MKTAFLLITVLSLSKCHQTTETKSEDVLSTAATENETTQDVKDKRDKSVPVKNVNDEQRVYLEDVFYSLKNQNWTKDQEPCLNKTLFMLSSLKNFSLWAVWEWDSIPSEPVGLLYGNLYQLGNFDECMSPPWAASHPELSSQYCLADVKLVSQRKKHQVDQPFDPYSSALDFMQYKAKYSRPINELKWGVCVPSSCSKASVERLLTILLLRSHLGTTGLVPRINVTQDCQVPGGAKDYDAGFYGFWVFLAIFTVVALICTHLNSCVPETSNILKHQIIRSFCLKNNSKDLLRMKTDGIEVLYGMRYLTICFIVMDHQMGIFNGGGPISDGRRVDSELLFSLAGTLVLHNDLFVDTFFFLSGFLAICNLLKMNRLPNPLVLILKRYVRLVVAFAVVVFYMATVFQHTGTGPLWPLATGDAEVCKQNWWLSLLMLNNYVNSENICIVVSWYIPCDFHFFCITVILYWLYQKQPKPVTVLAVAMAVAALILPGIVNYMNSLPAVQLFTYDFITNPRGSEQFHLTYIKSHTRMAAYLVGLAGGYIFSTYKKSGDFNRISKKWSIIGAWSGILVMLVVMVTGALFLHRDYSAVEGAIYAALDRPVWSFGLGLLVLSCSLGTVPLIKSFLTWYAWVPLSRLAYGLYLTHTVLISRNVFIARNPRHNDSSELMTDGAGMMFWGTVAAYVIWLVFEAPANNMLMIMLRPRSRVAQEKPNLDLEKPHTSGIANCVSIDVKGHYSEKLPNPVQFSSKI